jgi:uncharacterized protein YukE
MLFMKSELSSAAAAIRNAEAQLSRTAAELADAGLWAGQDADRFQDDWRNSVRAPLQTAAGIIDAVAFVTL